MKAALRAAAEGVAPLTAPLASRAAPSKGDRYRLDPWAHLEDGHVRILSLEGLQIVRFEPYQHQIELVEGWIDLDHLRRSAQAGDAELRFRNALEEKSRQMGATWALAYAVLWIHMYFDVQGIVMHNDLAEVDDGGRASTTDSFFGKVRFMAEHAVDGPPDEERGVYWPEHLRPGRYLSFRARPSVIRNQLRPASFCVGAAQVPDVGRGRTYGYGILDEAARMAWGEAVHSSVTRAIPAGRLYNSTPKGKGNVYYRLVKTRPRSYRFMRHHWTQHPVYSRGLHIAGAEPHECPLCAGNARGLKWRPDEPVAHRYPGRPTSPWYDQAVEELTDEQVAAELEIDYEGSLTARVYAEFSEAAHVDPDGIPYDRRLPLEFDIDYGWGGSATAIHAYQPAPGELRMIAEAEVMQGTPETITAELVEALSRKGIPFRDLEPRFTVGYLMVGDPAGDARLATGGTLAEEYRKLGWNPIPGENSIPATVRAVKRLLVGKPVRLRVSGPDCPKAILAFTENRWPTDKTGKVKDGATQPVNDVHNDHMRAVAYYVHHKFPPPQLDEVLQEAATGHTPGELGGLEEFRLRREGGTIDTDIRPDMRF